MEMTVRDAIQYILKADGMPYTDELEDKIYKFMKKLPKDPEKCFYREWCICDYNEGWFAEIKMKVVDGKISIKLINGDNLDPSEDRVKTNQEALKVLNELENIKSAYDIDQYWIYSDDHTYYNKMSEIDNQAYWKRQECYSKLR